MQERPSQIWNLDESSFCIDPSKTKIVGQQGTPTTRTISGPGKQNTTVLMCCSAVGEKAPPLIIFKGKHVWEQWTAPPGTEFPNTTYAATSKGWMETTVFKNYFQNSFLQAIGPERPVLLIFSVNKVPITVDAGPSSTSKESLSVTSQEQQKISNVSFDELLLRSIKRENNPDLKKRKRVCLGAEVVTRADINKILSKNTTTKSKPENKT